MNEILHPQINRIESYPTVVDTAKAAAEYISAFIDANPAAAMTFATGETMKPVLGFLGETVLDGQVSLAQIVARHLDEYWPCSPLEEHSFVRYLRERAWTLGISPENTYEINGEAKDPDAEAARYEALLRERPSDLAILGIGPWDIETQTGGHIGFNEAGTPFDCGTHLASLHPSTKRRDREKRGQSTPDCAITQGIANISAAQKIMLVAYGENKGTALGHALYDPISTERPASALRKVGERVTIFLDEAAASAMGQIEWQSASMLV